MRPVEYMLGCPWGSKNRFAVAVFAGFRLQHGSEKFTVICVAPNENDVAYTAVNHLKLDGTHPRAVEVLL